MAKIVFNDLAPADASVVSMAGAAEAIEIPHETTNRELISNAIAHPWLEVEVDPETEVVDPDEFDTRLRAEDDHLSSINDHSNDPDLVREALEERREAEGAVGGLAVRPSLDQAEPVKEGPVALTFAADETDDDGDLN